MVLLMAFHDCHCISSCSMVDTVHCTHVPPSLVQVFFGHTLQCFQLPARAKPRLTVTFGIPGGLQQPLVHDGETTPTGEGCQQASYGNGSEGGRGRGREGGRGGECGREGREEKENATLHYSQRSIAALLLQLVHVV